MTQSLPNASNPPGSKIIGLGRLPFRVDPLEIESARGYIGRVAQIYSTSVSALGELLGLTQMLGLERGDNTEQIAYALRLEASEWRRLCYKQTNAKGQYGPTSFFGQSIGGDRLNYGFPRVCPKCLSEHAAVWGVWDLGLVCACPIHRCVLVHHCPKCGRRLRWQRPSLHQCYCQFDLRTVGSEPADSGLVAINATIYRAAGFPVEAAKADMTAAEFPSALIELHLDPLLRIIAHLGSTQEEKAGFMHHSRFASSLDAAIQTSKTATGLLANWPQSFHEMLRRMAPGDITAPMTRSIEDTFGKLHKKMTVMFTHAESGFLHDAFEDFIARHWKGSRRGHRHLDSQWIVAAEAGRVIGTRSVKSLVHGGALKGIFVKCRNGNGTECWITRESLTRWVAERDGKRASYMRRAEADLVLGLKRGVMLKLAHEGLIRSVNGIEHRLSHGIHLRRDDVMNIKDAFDRYLPLNRNLHPGAILPLARIIRRLTRTYELGAILRAVVAGTLVPVAHEKHLPGITAYCFPIEILHHYRRVSNKQAKSGEHLSRKEVASFLQIPSEAVPQLASRGFLGTSSKPSQGRSALYSVADVQHFAEQYVPLNIVAKKFRTNPCWLGKYLECSGIQLLTVQLHRERRLFIARCVASQLRTLSPGEQESVPDNSRSLASLPRYHVGLNTGALA